LCSSEYGYIKNLRRFQHLLRGYDDLAIFVNGVPELLLQVTDASVCQSLLAIVLESMLIQKSRIAYQGISTRPPISKLEFGAYEVAVTELPWCKSDGQRFAPETFASATVHVDVMSNEGINR